MVHSRLRTMGTDFVHRLVINFRPKSVQLRFQTATECTCAFPSSKFFWNEDSQSYQLSFIKCNPADGFHFFQGEEEGRYCKGGGILHKKVNVVL